MRGDNSSLGQWSWFHPNIRPVTKVTNPRPSYKLSLCFILTLILELFMTFENSRFVIFGFHP